MTVVIEPGDFVQARKGGDGDVAVLEFHVTSHEDGVLTGSLLGPLAEADGWTFELISKGEIALPTSLTKITAWTRENRTEAVALVGPVGGMWLDERGVGYSSAQILAWEPAEGAAE